MLMAQLLIQMSDLKRKTMTGSFWSLIERFGYLTCQFLSNLVLARLLMPADFGTIGILMVFVILSNVLIDSGFSASLIQKQYLNDKDKSTVFITNMILSLLVYCIVFVFAPSIAYYFKTPELSLYLRILEIVVIIDALCAIQNTLLTREMNFKRLTQIKLFSIFISSSIAIALAYWGLGVWALIIQYILFSIIRTSITWMVTTWYPKLEFSIESFKSLFSFGSKLLLSSMVAELYNNFQQVLIGRYYSHSDLGFYSQARQFQNIPTGTVTQVINAVAFPAYSKLQNERGDLLEIFRQNVRFVAFINTPLMFLLAVLAYPLFVFLYSEKWIGSVAYFQFLCIAFGVLLAVHQCSLSILKALGRSDYVLRLEIIKKILGVIFILIGMYFWGIWGILSALGLNSFIEIFLNGYYLGKEVEYNGLTMLIDMLPAIIVSTISGAISYLLLSVVLPFWGNLVSIIAVGLSFVIIYFFLARIFKVYGYQIVSNLLVRLVHEIKK